MCRTDELLVLAGEMSPVFDFALRKVILLTARYFLLILLPTHTTYYSYEMSPVFDFALRKVVRGLILLTTSYFLPPTSPTSYLSYFLPPTFLLPTSHLPTSCFPYFLPPKVVRGLILLPTSYFLPTIYYLLPTTYYLLPTTDYLGRAGPRTRRRRVRRARAQSGLRRGQGPGE